MFYFDWTYLLILPGLIFGLWAQSYVNRAYHQASGIRTRLSRPASEVVDEMLRRNGNRVVTVRRVAGELTDHYDPRSETLNLSEGVHDSASVAALGIAAHEAGHAMQKQEGYAPLKLRSGLVPAVNICSTLSTPLFVLGLLFSWSSLLYVGIALFAASTVFALVTLPVEFNASSRAMRMLTSGGYLTEQEAGQARKVLNAAALTYVAAAVTSLLSLLRLLVIARRRDS